MLHSVVSSLLASIQDLSFADKVGGIVYPLQKQIKNAEGNFVTKTFPVYGNDPSVCESGDYIDMVPDDSLKSVIYFESSAENMSSCSDVVTSNATLTLIAWFNLSKINQALRSGEGMLRVLAATLNGTYNMTISGVDVHVVLSLTNINFRDPAIFSKWSYQEPNKQYLIYPRDFGALTFDVQLNYGLCDEEPNIDPAC